MAPRGRTLAAAVGLAAAATPAFVAVSKGAVSAQPVQRGSTAPEVTQSAPGLTALGFAASAVAVTASGVFKPRRQLKTARQFFGGGGSAPAPKKPTSYKDFQDPWLGSADLSFDPLSLAVQGGIFDTAETAVPETTYYNYRESEVKHGRFAMTAFLAIFGEAADRGALFRQMGSTSAVDNLDGTLGLDEVQAPLLLTLLGYQALAEYNLQRDEDDGNFLSVEYKKDRIPGDLGFDPLGLGKGAGADVKGVHNVEVNTGRLAMIGVTAFLFKEFVAKDL